MDNALVSAAVLSNRYISDRFLPDKAIDLVDEACALIKTEMDSLPAELDEMNRKILQLQIEETALKKEEDNLSKERLEELNKKLVEWQQTEDSEEALATIPQLDIADIDDELVDDQVASAGERPDMDKR